MARTVLAAFVLITIIIYWYALFAYQHLQSDLNNKIDDSCNTLFSCTVVIFDSWYKYDGAIGGYLPSALGSGPDTNLDYDPDWRRFIYDLSFNLIIGILLIEIMGGIIIDTFSEIRQEADKLKSDQESRCFVCNQTRLNIDGFHDHTRFKHNIWDYHIFIFYLVIKNKTAPDYMNYIENHIYQQIKTIYDKLTPSHANIESKCLPY
jgi:hypothetical protein